MRGNAFPSNTGANRYSFGWPDNLRHTASNQELVGNAIINKALKSTSKDRLVTKSGLHAIRLLGSDNVGSLGISISIDEPIRVGQLGKRDS